MYIISIIYIVFALKYLFASKINLLFTLNSKSIALLTTDSSNFGTKCILRNEMRTIQ